MNRTFFIPNVGEVSAPLGVFKYLFIRSSDVVFQISFDGWNWVTARQNDRFDKSTVTPPPEKIFLKAFDGLSAEVSIDYDTKPIGSQDTAQSIVLNTALGCGGSGIALTVPAAKTAANVNYTYDAGDPVDLTKNNLIYIPGTVNGRKRKSIIFDNRSGTADVVIFADDGSLVHRLASTDAPLAIEASSDFYVGGNNGGSAKFIYSELFYEKSNS